jgi:hypothetical protein
MPKLFVSNVLGFDISLLERFVTYYGRFGPRFLFTINMSRGSRGFREAVAIISHCCDDYEVFEWDGEFSEDMKMRHEEEAIRRNCKSDDFVIYADSDEFQHYPGSLLEDFVGGALGVDHIRGVLVDRVAADGSLAPFDSERSLERQYPMGGDITWKMLKGCPNKIACARADVVLEGGHHYVEGRPRCYEEGAQEVPAIDVHHFKWNGGTLGKLKRQRRMRHESLEPWRSEHAIFLEYIDRHGRVLIEDEYFGFETMEMVLDI